MRPLALAVSLVLALSPRALHAQPRPMPGGTFDGRTFPSHWARRPLLDAARAAANVDVAWQRFLVLGHGATVCVVDTGVDLTHRDFRDSLDHTRVDWLLDLDRAPRGSEPALEARFGGAVFRGDELDAMLAAGDPDLPADWHGHGTAIASAAAGDDAPPGAATPGNLAGVAPDARLVVVRALRRGTPGFEDADIARGAAFCAAVADPAHTVALLSLGGHDGPHDGSSAIELALSDLVARGLTIVVAAGNDGGRTFHAGTRVADDGVARLALRVPAPESTDAPHVAVVVRGARSVALVLPDASRVAIPDGRERWTRATAAGTFTIDASRGDGAIDVVLAGDAMHPLLGDDFVIEVAGPGRVDAWIASSDLGTALFDPTFTGPTAIPGDEIAIPATCPDVIAVGASVSRATLLASDGGPALTLDADGEGRALFSSRGPSASGALRPDVLAPGGWVVAARSSAVDPSDPEALVHGHASQWSHLSRPDERLAIAGTSVSAAIVAGALALAIEAAPLDPMRDREALAFSAMRANDEAFTPARGFGGLDVAAFLGARTIADAHATGGALSASRPFVTPGATDVSLALVTDVPEDAWVTFWRDGEPIARAPLRAGVARAPIAVGRALPGTDVRFTATRDGDDRELASVAVPVRWDDDGADAVPTGSGCGTGARPSSRACLALVLLACWARTRRSRRLTP